MFNIKILPLIIFVIPGIIAYSLPQNGLMILDKPDQALPTLIGSLLPVGLKGLVIAGLLAALMSSLSSVFNSCSTLITLDIYKKIHPEASQKQLVITGQVSTIFLVGFGLAWIPFMQFISGQIYQYLQSIQAYISPPIAAVFLLGLFIKRLNGTGAIASLLTGFFLGMGRLIAELNKESLSGILYSYADINFLHFAIFLFIICSVVLIVVSLITNPQNEKQIKGLTFETAEKSDSDPIWRRKDIAFSIILLIVVGFVWIYFSG